MKTLLKFLVWAIWLITNSLYSQVESNAKSNSWYFLYSRQHYSPKWSSSLEIHERTQLSNLNHKNFLFRPSLDYHLFKKMEVSMGYTFIHSYLNDQFNSIEHNSWEQIFNNFEIHGFNGYQRLRLENRWNQQYITHFDSNGLQHGIVYNGYQYSNRFRYRIGGTLPIGQSKVWFGSLFNEIWINMNSKLQFTSLARNWVYLGVGYHLSNSNNLQLGYLHQRDFKSPIENTNVVQLSYSHNFHFDSSNP